MAGCVAGHLKNFCACSAEFNHFSISNLNINAGNSVRVIRRTHDGAAPLRFERFVTPGMIKMMMGIENMRQLPASLLKGSIYRRDLGRIDGGCCA